MNKVDLEQVEQCLLSLSDILAEKKFSPHWEAKLRSLAKKRTLHADDFRSQVKRLYGGMGSLNDLVICDASGKMDRQTNIRFDELRQRLFDLVR